MHKTSDDLATISMISDEITMIFCLGIIVSHREMPKVGVVNRLRMRIVQNLVEFPPPLIALHPHLDILGYKVESLVDGVALRKAG